MRMKHYHEAQDQRWYEQWVESERALDAIERAISELEVIALNNIYDEAVKDQIRKLVDSVWRGKRQ